MVTTVFLGSVIAAAAAVLAFAAVWIAYDNGAFVMRGPDVIGIESTPAAWTIVGLFSPRKRSRSPAPAPRLGRSASSTDPNHNNLSATGYAYAPANSPYGRPRSRGAEPGAGWYGGPL